MYNTAELKAQRFDSLDLDIPASVAAGAALAVNGYDRLLVVIQGTFTATIELQMSLDGGNTFVTHTSKTAPAIVELPGGATHIRANTSAHGNGTPVGKVRAQNPSR